MATSSSVEKNDGSGIFLVGSQGTKRTQVTDKSFQKKTFFGYTKETPGRTSSQPDSEQYKRGDQ